MSEEANKLDTTYIPNVLFGERPETRPSPGQESAASDVTMDSLTTDMMGSPSGSLESGEENTAFSPNAADISTIDFSDMLADGKDQDDLMFFDYLLRGPDNTGPLAGAESCVGSPESNLDELESVVNIPSKVVIGQSKSQVYGTTSVQLAPQATASKPNNVILKVVMPQQFPGAKPRGLIRKIVPEFDEEEVLEKNKKNAIQARINRQKKKAYMEDLEAKVSSLARENDSLKKESRKLEQDKSSLEEEAAYLRRVIANQSTLSGLVKNIENNQNARLTSSFSRKRSADMDHDYGTNPSVKKPKKSAAPFSGGVCLYVDRHDVSIEFCHHCAEKSIRNNDNE